jgi:3-hydroxyisobutyrate dehydrogenase
VARIGFVGIGTMGQPMARHLIAAGHELVACDLDRARAESLGGRVVDTAAEAAAGADFVILSLPSPAAVEAAALGDGGVRSAAAPGLTCIDMSTGPPALASRLAAALGAAGADFLDAPVSGGPRGAESASLTIMVGGPEDVFRRALPVLERLGGLVRRIGPTGSGQAAKLCNNLVAGATMVAIAEACALAEREGIDAGTLYEILTASTGDSRVLRTRFPLPGVDQSHPSGAGFAPLFSLDLMAKDLTLASEAARAHGISTPVADAALASYGSAQERGRGSLDYSAVYSPADDLQRSS